MGVKKKLAYLGLLVLGIAAIITLAAPLRADNSIQSVSVDQREEAYISSIYNKIDFCHAAALSYTVFKTAFKGYVSLRAAGKLQDQKALLSVCDFNLSSNVRRLWVIDLAANKVLENTYVAHGQGSGEEFAAQFSNKENSHQSSLGFFVTGDTYDGGHGPSLYLHGMDQSYNTAAFKRYIVLHGAAYVSEQFIAANQRLGRSWGCPAVSEAIAGELIDMIKGGTCLFIYAADKAYLASSYWLRKNNPAIKDLIQEERFKFNEPQELNSPLKKQSSSQAEKTASF